MEGLSFVEIISDISIKIYRLLYEGMPSVLKFFITKFEDMEGMEFVANDMGLGEYMPLDLMLGIGIVSTLVFGIMGFIRRLIF